MLKKYSEGRRVAPLALTITEACEVTRIGRTSLYEVLKTGELTARKRGKTILILVADLERWLHSLPVADFGEHSPGHETNGTFSEKRDIA